MVMSSIRGQTTLALLHKHGEKESELTMSFYLTVTSSGSSDIFSDNQGGDFKVQLDHTLDMRSDPWEVALVDMIYTEQVYPNLPIEEEQVQMKVSGRPEFENDYFITYDQTLDLWLSFKLERRDPTAEGGRKVLKQGDFYLPR